MEEGQGDQHGLLPLTDDREHAIASEGIECQIRMRKLGAFGLSGGAGRIEDDGGVRLGRENRLEVG